MLRVFWLRAMECCRYDHLMSQAVLLMNVHILMQSRDYGARNPGSNISPSIMRVLNILEICRAMIASPTLWMKDVPLYWLHISRWHPIQRTICKLIYEIWLESVTYFQVLHCYTLSIKPFEVDLYPFLSSLHQAGGLKGAIKFLQSSVPDVAASMDLRPCI